MSQKSSSQFYAYFGTSVVAAVTVCCCSTVASVSLLDMYRLMICFLVFACAPTAIADDASYALGVGVSADNADGFSATALFDASLNEAASVSVTIGSTRASARPVDLRTREWSIGARYDFGLFGLEARTGQSGDPDDFDATDVMIGVFKRTDKWRLSAQYMQRNIDLILRTLILATPIELTVPLDADGLRLSARYKTDNRWAWYGSYRQFDYDRDLSPLAGRFIVQRLTPTTLTLASSLLDTSVAIGVEMPLKDQRALNFSLARDELAGGLGTVSSASIGLLTPLGKRGDLDINIGASRSNNSFDDGSALFLSVLYLHYGFF